MFSDVTIAVFMLTTNHILMYFLSCQIILDSCKRVGLVFEGVVSAMEVINSQSVQIQVHLVGKTKGGHPVRVV